MSVPRRSFRGITCQLLSVYKRGRNAHSVIGEGKRGVGCNRALKTLNTKVDTPLAETDFALKVRLQRIEGFRCHTSYPSQPSSRAQLLAYQQLPGQAVDQFRNFCRLSLNRSLCDGLRAATRIVQRPVDAYPPSEVQDVSKNVESRAEVLCDGSGPLWI